MIVTYAHYFNGRIGNQVAHSRRPWWSVDSVLSPTSGPVSVSHPAIFYHPGTCLGRHCIPNFCTLTVPPDIVGFRPRIQQEYIDTTDDNQDSVPAFVYRE